MERSIVSYYSARSNEYEKVYAKPERQPDLGTLHEIVPAYLAGRRVLEVACGTGYWTRRIAARSAAMTGCDMSEEVLALARANQPVEFPATFVAGDAFALHTVFGAFNAAFVGFWWSHVLTRDLPRFLDGLHQRLEPQSQIVIVDNRYVDGSNWPITRTDDEGNTYQQRFLENGAEYEVLKNFSSASDVSRVITGAGGVKLEILELQYYWCAVYQSP